MAAGTAQGIAIHSECKGATAVLVEIDCRPATTGRQIANAVAGPRVTKAVIDVDAGPVINPTTRRRLPSWRQPSRASNLPRTGRTRVGHRPRTQCLATKLSPTPCGATHGRAGQGNRKCVQTELREAHAHNVTVEIPKGERNKYELDPATGGSSSTARCSPRPPTPRTTGSSTTRSATTATRSALSFCSSRQPSRAA
jgi:hypothetical protein